MSSSATVGLLRQSHATDSRWKASSEQKEAIRKALSDSSWADGLRGIAAVFVMFSHMSLAFARYVVAPAVSANGPSYWMQRPILRLVGQGPAWVACFVILSGYVNSLRPIKLSRAGQVEAALDNMATSAFRRTFRLFLPATAATIGSWFICQLGAYEIARNSDAFWLSITSPKRSSSWGTAIDDLIRAIRDTWMFDPSNQYDQPQWALLYLLLGSMYCFAALLMFVKLTPGWRTGALIGVWCLGWNWDVRLSTPLIAVGIFSGMLLAELHHSDIPLRLSRYSPFFAPPLVLISLILMSFPAEFQNTARWSNLLLQLHYKIFPKLFFIDRNLPTIGASLLCFTITMSPHLRNLLSKRPLLWLGKISFPLYLLHGSFMRSIMAWLLFANQNLVEMEERNGQETYVVMKYPLPTLPTFLVVMPIFFPILFFATHLWANKVEPHFGVITKTMENICVGKELSKPTVLPTRQD